MKVIYCLKCLLVFALVNCLSKSVYAQDPCEMVTVTIDPVTYNCSEGLSLSANGGESPYTFSAFDLATSASVSVENGDLLDNGNYLFTAIDYNQCNSPLSPTLNINCMIAPCDTLQAVFIDHDCISGIQLGSLGSQGGPVFFAVENTDTLNANATPISNGTVLNTGNYVFYALDPQCTSEPSDTVHINCAPDCLGDLGGVAVIGSDCDDEDASSFNDVYDENCNCDGVECPTSSMPDYYSQICSGEMPLLNSADSTIMNAIIDADMILNDTTVLWFEDFNFTLPYNPSSLEHSQAGACEIDTVIFYSAISCPLNESLIPSGRHIVEVYPQPMMPSIIMGDSTAINCEYELLLVCPNLMEVSSSNWGFELSAGSDEGFASITVSNLAGCEETFDVPYEACADCPLLNIQIGDDL